MNFVEMFTADDGWWLPEKVASINENPIKERNVPEISCD